MIQSMTGFGRSSRDFGHMQVSVEIRSVNSRSFDFKARIPSIYREKEMEIRSILSRNIDRGKIDLVLDVNRPDGGTDLAVNETLFRTYARKLKQLAEEEGIGTGDLLYTLSRIPNVISGSDALVNEEEWLMVVSVIEDAVQSFKRYRFDEGKSIENDFRERVAAITHALNEIPKYEQERLDKLRARLVSQLEEWAQYTDENRLEQELVFYVEKLDISEEKLRLRQHCEYFLEQLDKVDESKGKILSFIAQEMGREINTIGSKANSAEIQRHVVQMKDELEKIKEQVANVL
jgi:uncharacterized protein (TIGR00255 family)